VTPVGGKIGSVAGLEEFAELDRGIPGIEALIKEEHHARQGNDDQFKLRFVPIDLRQSFPPGATAAQVTKYGMDKSWLLGQVVARYPTEVGVLGELQLAFVSFVVGQSYAAFERWKTLVRLFCNCDEALVERKNLFLTFFGNLSFFFIFYFWCLTSFFFSSCLW